MKSFFAVLFGFFAIAFHSCTKSGHLRQGTLYLSLHERAKGKISGDMLSLQFDSVISDSRCPVNATCIWQGTAVAKFSLTKNGETHPVVLSTVGMHGVYREDTVLFG